MTFVFDTGSLIALERNDRAMWRRMKAAHVAGEPPVTHGGVVGQVWRGGGARQVPLARALDSLDVRPLDQALGRATGDLLRRSRRSDVIDAALVLLANDHDAIVTSDPDGIEPLARAAGRRVELIRV